MADELNTPNHRYYQNRYNVKLAPNEMSKQWILASGIARIDNAAVLPLFASAEPGTWFDPSDLTTLFQDSAGTTPVTAPGQTVGLMLDKSQGLVLGSELVTNGDFSSGTTGWTGGAATLSVVSGNLRITATGAFAYASTAVATVIGKTYLVNATLVADAMTGNSFLYAGTILGGGDVANSNLGSTPRTATITFVAVSTTTYISIAGSSATLAGEYLDWDNISCKLTAGYPAFQGVEAQKPRYGINPIVGTRNLLTYTEQFDNAAWTKTNVTVTANATVAPDGTTTADKIIATNTASTTRALRQSFTVPSTATYTFSAYAKAAEYTRFALQDISAGRFGATFDLSAGTTASLGGAGFVSSSITSVGDGWFRCSVVWNGVAAAVHALTAIGYPSGATLTAAGISYAGDGTSGIHAWGAQIELGSTATAYQKVVSQYEVTQAGVQSAGYLAFDGVDDGMVTNTITPGIDKVQVFAGVRKLSDATALIAELSATRTSNAGSWSMIGTTGYSWASRGSLFPVGTNSGVIAAPSTNVLTGIGGINDDLMTFRVNGDQVETSSVDQGTGNYLAYPLYIGRRGGASLPFSGRLYSLITRFGANLTDGQIASTESWVNAKTGAY